MTILTLSNAKLHLGITVSTNDVELQTFIDATVSAVENYVGPVDSRSVTEVAGDGSNDCLTLQLQQVPALTITSVTSIYTSGPVWLTAALHLDPDTGTVRRLDRGGFYLGPWTVVYTAGRSGGVPAAIDLAARMIVQNLWQHRRGGGGSKRPAQGGSSDMVTLPGWGFAIPNAAAQLLEPFEKISGFA